MHEAFMIPTAANQNCSPVMSADGGGHMTEAKSMLEQAASLTASGQHGAAMKLAYEASEHIAVAYLSGTTGQNLPPCDATYDLFDNLMREDRPTRHAVLPPEQRAIVGSVSVLREIYEPTLLHETTAADAQQMIEHVARLLELVKALVAGVR